MEPHHISSLTVSAISSCCTVMVVGLNKIKVLNSEFSFVLAAILLFIAGRALHQWVKGN